MRGAAPLGLPEQQDLDAYAPRKNMARPEFGTATRKRCVPRRPEKFGGTTARWGTFGDLERPKWG